MSSQEWLSFSVYGPFLKPLSSLSQLAFLLRASSTGPEFYGTVTYLNPYHVGVA